MRRLLPALIVLATLAGAPSAGADGRLALTGEDCSLDGRLSSPSVCPTVVYVSNDDGSGLRRVTIGAAPGEPPVHDYAPTWSPDGASLAVQRVHKLESAPIAGSPYTHNHAIWVVSADGTSQRRLIPPQDAEGLTWQTRPTWSPDGSLIAFHGSNAVGWPAVAPGVFVVDAEGGTPRRVSPENEHARWPSFTADGRVTYVTQRFDVPGSRAPHGAEATIWAADPLTGERVPLLFGDVLVANGSVSPSGRWMLLLTARAGAYRVQTLAMDGSGLVDRMSSESIGWAKWMDDDRLIHLDRTTEALQLFELDVAGEREPRPLPTPPWTRDFDWHSAGLPVATAAAGRDRVPPTVTLVRGARGSRLPFLAADASGIASVRVAIARRLGKGRCRFATPAGRLGATRKCERRLYRGIPDAGAWTRLTDALPRGRYALRFRTEDVHGNATRRPRAHEIRLRGAPQREVR